MSEPWLRLFQIVLSKLSITRSPSFSPVKGVENDYFRGLLCELRDYHMENT